MSLRVGDEITQEDTYLVADSEMNREGLIAHHISSMNNFYSTGINQIITRVFRIKRDMPNTRDTTPEDKSIKSISISVQFTRTTLSKPTMRDYQGGVEILVYPQTAIHQEKSYRGILRVDAEIQATAHLKSGGTIDRKEMVHNLQIGKIPIMVGSNMCNTCDLPREARARLHEDPDNTGGYFIINGAEWAIDCIENILFNEIRIFKNAGYGRESIRMELVSKPGDSYQNQDYLVIRWMTDGQITCEVASGSLKGIPIPFHMLFRILGWSTDRKIYEHVLVDGDAPYTMKMKQYLQVAFEGAYTMMNGVKQLDKAEAIRVLINTMKHDKFESLELDKYPDNYPRAVETIHKHIDENLLSRIGLTSRSRADKARFIALVIHKMFRVELGLLKPTDRDSYRSKRIHAAGESFAKPFKTYFNAMFVQKIKQRFVKEFKRQPFSLINLGTLMKSTIVGLEFSRLLLQSITVGTKSQLTLSVTRKVTNRLSSQLLNRKNPLNVLSVLRQVTTTTDNKVKQTERAQEMRRVHMSFLGYICLAHSPDGEIVGLRKQMAITASICKASSSEVIKAILLGDPEVRAYATTPIAVISALRLCNVYANGELIGLVPSAARFADKYRKLRRAEKIDPMTTIHWEVTQNELYFWVDVGRITRPLLIVYNNKRDKLDARGAPITFVSSPAEEKKSPSGDEKTAVEFTQGIALSADLVEKLFNAELTITHLLQMGVVEYITPDEQENCYICPSYDMLMKRRHAEAHEYTHCDIPDALLGLTAHVAALGHHNQTTRCIYLTIQAKQTCGRFAENWPYRCDKEAFLQYTTEKPLVTTRTNRYSPPNGMNMIVGYNCAAYNVEDSIVIGIGCTQRGIADGSHFTFYKSEIDQKEEFRTPSADSTTGLRDANYTKLNKNGIVEIGECIVRKDVIIGKVGKNSRSGDEKYNHIDQSIIYQDDEPAVVSNVIISRNEDDVEFRKVVLRMPRSPVVGDKFSSRSGQKGICAYQPLDSELPRTPDGMAPELIINPHGMPSRMTIAQMMETTIGGYCAAVGAHIDGSMFRQVDMKFIGDELVRMGLDRDGYRRMYHGETGLLLDSPIFIGPTYYQRLQKFVVDQVYGIGHGPTDALTMQPMNGKARNGGLRIGEMECWCLAAHGVANFMREKLGDHSDGYNWDICRCGKPAITNKVEKIFKCLECKDTADLVEIPTCWSTKLFIQELESMGVGVRITPTPPTTEIYLKPASAASGPRARATTVPTIE